MVNWSQFGFTSVLNAVGPSDAFHSVLELN